jgi:branched-chain amino acid aminotransferase
MLPMRWLNREYGAVPDEWDTHGCFETMRVYQGKVFRLREHLVRLYESAHYLQTRPNQSLAVLEQELLAAVAQSGLQEAVLRVALVPHGDRPTEVRAVVQPVVMPSEREYQQGIAIAVVPARSFPVASIDPRAKYSARLGSKLAILDAIARGVDEALFLDARGFVTENTASNYAIVRFGKVLTPPCYLGLLWGVTRQMLFDCAQRLGVACEERPLTRHDIYNAEEAFLTSTIKEVLPIVKVDGRRIGTGNPGPVARQFLQAFRVYVEEELGISYATGTGVGR